MDPFASVAMIDRCRALAQDKAALQAQLKKALETTQQLTVSMLHRFARRSLERLLLVTLSV
jgi:ATP-dependent exoDNAse (exonuclease V) beta subunit